MKHILTSQYFGLFSSGASLGMFSGLLISLLLSPLWFWTLVVYFVLAFYLSFTKVFHLLLDK